jgi:hypothetical protein
MWIVAGALVFRSAHCLLTAILPIDIVWLSGPNPVVLGVTLLFCVFGTLCFSLGPALKLSAGGLIQAAGRRFLLCNAHFSKPR